MSRRYIAIDLGAESGRAMLADVSDQHVSLHEIHRFANTPVRLNTGLYWDVPRLFHEICESIRAACNAAEDLDGIALDAWGVDFGLIGPSGALIDLPRHYRDQRTDRVQAEVFTRIPRDEIFRETGVQFMAINSLYQLAAMQRDSPELLDLASTLLFIPDLFNYYLTGCTYSERTVASTSQFYNPTRHAFATDMLRRLGIGAAFLPELIDPGKELGSVLPYVVELCNLRRELPVFATAAHDTAAAVAAIPARPDENWCFLSSGTWSLMGVELAQPLLNDLALDANFTNEVGIEHTIRFLKNIPGLWVLQECRRAWARAGQHYEYSELMEGAAQANDLSTVVDLEGFIAPGNYPEMLCRLCKHTNQQVPWSPAEITRVILNSLAWRYCEVLQKLESLTGRDLQVLYIVGGGSRNRLLNQITANATGKRVVAGPAEATAVGNALVQALGAGVIDSLWHLREVTRKSFAIEEFLPE
jgi:rhamnulokinase